MDTVDTTGTGTPEPLTGVNDAASAFESLLTPSGDTKDEVEATEPEVEETEAEAEETETEGEEEATEAEADEAEEEEAGSEDEEEGQPAAKVGRKFTVRIDGKDEYVDQSELIAGYSRQSDYTRKTQTLANERKAFEQESATTRQERAEYAQLLPQLRKAVESQMGKEPDWAALRRHTTPKRAPPCSPTPGPHGSSRCSR